MELPLDQVKAAHERWVAANARANTKRLKIKRDLKQRQEPIVLDEQEDADLTDINDLFAEKKNGPHMAENEFEPVSNEISEYESDRTRKITRHWKWKHKLTKHVVKRFPTPSGTGWDTGCLWEYLRKITEEQHKAAYQRAVHVIKLNNPNKPKVPKGKSKETAAEREKLFRQWVSLWCYFCFFHLSPLT